jgi:hypothetical protein
MLAMSGIFRFILAVRIRRRQAFLVDLWGAWLPRAIKVGVVAPEPRQLQRTQGFVSIPIRGKHTHYDLIHYRPPTSIGDGAAGPVGGPVRCGASASFCSHAPPFVRGTKATGIPEGEESSIKVGMSCRRNCERIVDAAAKAALIAWIAGGLVFASSRVRGLRRVAAGGPIT